ncbi:asparagine synthetase AsnA [Spiroplasma endosymbiont of Stenodema calcarata]|uniref:asparagine synthetase AsnA n=1 Tax=Spiroplasma endosymbiont of Stenodema calcarata TaxID=3139328 RepID=UPI003CCB082B
MAHGIQIGYSSILTLRETVEAISLIKRELARRFIIQFNLLKVDAPLISFQEKGLNDDFQMTERPIDFDISPSNLVAEILQSHNKWRRSAIVRYDLGKNEGILTTATVLRRDIKQSNSQAVTFNEIGFDLLLDEKKITLLKIQETIDKAINIIGEVENILLLKFSRLNKKFDKKLNWKSYTELQKAMRLLSYQERLNRYTRENGATILYGLKNIITNNTIEISESQDVFNWELYAKIFVYDFVLEKAICLGYCGATVNRDILKDQLAVTKETIKLKTEYDAKLATNEWPVTLSFGIYKSQLDLFLLEKQHIGEVVASVWSDDLLEYAEKNGIDIL